MGSLQVTDTIDIPINGLFVMGLTLLITAGVVLLLYPLALGPAGARHRRRTAPWPAPSASTRKQVDRFTFALGCGIAGIAGAAFTTIGSTGRPAARSTSWIRSWSWSSAARRACSAPSRRPSTIAQAQSIAGFFLTGSMAQGAHPADRDRAS